MKRRNIFGILLLLLISLGSGVAFGSATNTRSANEAEKEAKRVSGESFARIQSADPILTAPYSQVHRTLNVAEYLAATGAQTVSFEFIQGIPDPIFSCPTSGFPVPATWSISNPLQRDPSIQRPNDDAAVVSQAEPALGVFTGDTTATYVLCIAPNKNLFVHWVEGIVSGGFPLGTTWDYDKHRVVLPNSVPKLDVEVDAKKSAK